MIPIHVYITKDYNKKDNTNLLCNNPNKTANVNEVLTHQRSDPSSEGSDTTMAYHPCVQCVTGTQAPVGGPLYSHTAQYDMWWRIGIEIKVILKAIF